MTPRFVTRLLFLLAVLLHGACSTTPQASFYALNTTEGPTPDMPSRLVLALGPISLPMYLDRPQIVSRAGDNRLYVDEFNRWGGTLEEEIGRVLAQHLSRRLATQRVYGYPSRIVPDTDYRIALDVRGFDGALGGEVRLDVAWSVVADRSGEVVETRQASYRSVSRGEGYEAYAAALSDALAQLGDDMVAVIERL